MRIPLAAALACLACCTPAQSEKPTIYVPASEVDVQEPPASREPMDVDEWAVDQIRMMATRVRPYVLGFVPPELEGRHYAGALERTGEVFPTLGNLPTSGVLPPGELEISGTVWVQRNPRDPQQCFQGGVLTGRGVVHATARGTFGSSYSLLYAGASFKDQGSDSMFVLGGAHHTMRDMTIQSNRWRREYTSANVKCALRVEDFIAGIGGGSHTIENVCIEAFPIAVSFGEPDAGPYAKGNGDETVFDRCFFHNNQVDVQVNTSQAVALKFEDPVHYGPWLTQETYEGKVDYDIRSGGNLSIDWYHKVGPGTMLRVWTSAPKEPGEPWPPLPGRSGGTFVVDGGKVDQASFDRGDFRILDMGDFTDPDEPGRTRGSAQVIVTVKDFHVGDLRRSRGEGEPPWVTAVGLTNFNWVRGSETLPLPERVFAWHETRGGGDAYIPVFRVRDAVTPEDPRDLCDPLVSTGRCYLIHSGCVDRLNRPVPPRAWLWNGQAWEIAYKIEPADQASARVRGADPEKEVSYAWIALLPATALLLYACVASFRSGNHPAHRN